MVLLGSCNNDIVHIITLSEPCPATGGLAQHGGASDAKDHGLGVGENGGDLVASGALDVHEVGVGVLHQALQLVLALLLVGARVQKVLGELERTRPELNQLSKPNVVRETAQLFLLPASCRKN